MNHTRKMKTSEVGSTPVCKTGWDVMLRVVQQGEQRAHIEEKKKSARKCHPSLPAFIHPSFKKVMGEGAGLNPGEGRAAEGDLGRLVTAPTRLDKQPSAPKTEGDERLPSLNNHNSKRFLTRRL